MVFLAFEDMGEEIAADEIAHAFAMGDRLLQHGKRLHLQLKVGFQHLFDRFADAKAAEELEIGEAVKEQDALRHLVGVLHLVDRFAIFELGELLDAPMLQHSVMEKILVDRRRSEEHTSELQSLMRISYAVFCLKKKK